MPRIAVPLLAGLVAIVLTGLVLEVALRLILPPPVHYRFPQEFYDWDPETGHVLRPRQDSYTHHHPVHINSHGCRDRDYAPAPPPGTRRVLALGDSQTFGVGLPLRATWPKQLERLLNAADRESSWQVINCGVPATDTWQHEILLRRLEPLYRPEAVVLAFYVNDVSPVWPSRHRLPDALTPDWRRRLIYGLKRSALLTLLWQRFQLLSAAYAGGRGMKIESDILTGTPDTVVERGWAQVAESLNAMRATAERAGAALVVVALPRRDDVAGAIDARAYHQRVGAIGRELGVSVLDPLPELRAAAEDAAAPLFIPWDGHNGPAANRVIALAVARWIRRGRRSGVVSRGNHAAPQR